MNIQTERLMLKSVAQESLNDLVELFTDEMVKKTYMVPDFPNRAAVEELAGRLVELSGGDAPLVAGIYLGGQLIGILNETERQGNGIELGYAILPRYHKQGYATEALRGVIGYLFRLGFREVIAGAFSENTASIRVMEKSGMTATGNREHIRYRNQDHECVFYSVRKEGVS